jgi:hypothetical protein
MKKSNYKKSVEEYKNGLEISIEMSSVIIENSHAMIDIHKRSILVESRRRKTDLIELNRVNKQLKKLK